MLGETALAMVGEMNPSRRPSGTHDVADALAQPGQREFGLVARDLGRSLDDLEPDAGGFGLDLQRESRALAHDPEITDQAGRRRSEGFGIQGRVAEDSVVPQIEARADAQPEAVIARRLAGEFKDPAILLLMDPAGRLLDLFQVQAGTAEDLFGIGACCGNVRPDPRHRRGADSGFGNWRLWPPLPRSSYLSLSFLHAAPSALSGDRRRQDRAGGEDASATRAPIPDHLS